MINYYYSRGTQPGRRFPFGNPIANALVVLVGALTVVATIVLGFIAFIALGSLLLVLGAIIGIRVWWFNRKLSRGGQGGGAAPAGTDQVRIHIIEGEYRDLSGRGSNGDGNGRA